MHLPAHKASWASWRVVISGVGVGALCAVAIPLSLTKLQHGQLLSIQTGSMVPALHRGDLVQVTPVPASTIQRGDIVTIHNPKNPAQTVTHRVVQTPSAATTSTAAKGLFQTKGDANTVPDLPVAAGQIVGKVTHAVPKLGTAVDFVRTPLGLALIIYLPALLIVGAELRNLARYFRTQQPYVAAIRRARNRTT